MLVLGRKVGMSIVIGEGANEVIVTVVTANNGQAKLGVTAPPHISVDREEIRAKKLAGTYEVQQTQ